MLDVKKQHANLSIILNWYITKFSRDLCLPSLPAIAVALNTPTRYVKYTVSFYFLGMGISRFLLAPMSDMFGRRAMILTSLPIFIIGSALCAFAGDIGWFIIGRTLQALGIGAVTAIGWAMIGDVYGAKDSTKALAYLSTLAMWAPALASALGGHLQTWFGWRAGFDFLTAGGALLYLQTLWGLHETNAHLQPKGNVLKQITKNYAQLVVLPEYWRYILTFSFSFSGTVAYYTAAPFLFINDLHIPAHIYGYFAFSTVAGLVVGRFIAVRTSVRYGNDKTLMLGLCCSSLAGLIMIICGLAIKPDIVTILGPSSLYFLGNGIMSPTAKAGTVTMLPESAGTAAALFGLMQGIAAFLASIASTYLPNRTGLGLGIIFLGVSLLAMVSFMIFRSRGEGNGMAFVGF